jgi:hypothetical protein
VLGYIFGDFVHTHLVTLVLAALHNDMIYRLSRWKPYQLEVFQLTGRSNSTEIFFKILTKRNN